MLNSYKSMTRTKCKDSHIPYYDSQTKRLAPVAMTVLYIRGKDSSFNLPNGNATLGPDVEAHGAGWLGVNLPLVNTTCMHAGNWICFYPQDRSLFACDVELTARGLISAHSSWVNDPAH